MTVRRYDPDTTPNAEDWLALDEMERAHLVKTYHQAQRERLPNLPLHAMFHTVVENQLAEGYAPAMRAMARLMAEGLSRHDAVHAIGSVVASFIYHASKTDAAGLDGDPNARIEADLDRLTAANWRQGGGGDAT